MQRSAFIWLVATGATITFIDQLSKEWVRATISHGTVLPVAGRLSFTHVANTGLVFGLGQGNVLLPTFASVLILALIPIVLKRLQREYGYIPTLLEAMTIGAIAGGAIGNLVDRVVHQHVTDFILVRLFSQTFWPAFNVADAAIVTGTILLAILIARREVQSGNQQTATN